MAVFRTLSDRKENTELLTCEITKELVNLKIVNLKTILLTLNYVETLSTLGLDLSILPPCIIKTVHERTK